MRLRHASGGYEIVTTSMAGAMEMLPRQSIIVTDANVHRHWARLFPRQVPCHILPPGEQAKSLEQYERLLHWCADTGASRSTSLIALGGGVVGDLAGFVAATYMRGIPLIQIPTTLLAQVDAAIGGKTGIDLPQGKNLAGAFYQPVTVLVPTDALSTLDARHFRNGMAEVVKYAFILDPALLHHLESRLDPNSPQLADIIQRCISLKVQVVEEDEKETSGRRAILNFGHTIGHAIEKITGYSPILHGEAVGLGMIVEAKLGESLGITEEGVHLRLRECLAAQGLPVTDPVLKRTGEILEAIRLDKKANKGSLAFSLLLQPGGCKLVQDVPPVAVEAALREC